MDILVDGTFSEPVVLTPWTGGQHATNAGTPDPTRKPISTIGIEVMPGARASGEAGTVGAGLSTRIMTSAVWIAIREDYLGNAMADWKTYDRVYLPERPFGQRWFTIENVEPSATGRFNIKLIRLQPEPT